MLRFHVILQYEFLVFNAQRAHQNWSLCITNIWFISDKRSQYMTFRESFNFLLCNVDDVCVRLSRNGSPGKIINSLIFSVFIWTLSICRFSATHRISLAICLMKPYFCFWFICAASFISGSTSRQLEVDYQTRII